MQVQSTPPPRNTQVLVLGAGMVGVSCALALQQRGFQVTVVDRNRACRETSYGNAGIIQREAVEPYGFPRQWGKLARIALGRSNDVHYHAAHLLKLAPRLAQYWRNSAATPYARIAQAYAKLVEHSTTEHGAWVERAGAQNLVHTTGWREAYRTTAAFEAAAQHAQHLAQEAGLSVEIQGGTTLAALEPGLKIALAGAIQWNDPWTVRNPGSLVDHYMALFLRQGGQFVQGDAATLRHEGGRWLVNSREGTLDAAQVVLALGPWSDRATQALGYRLPLFVKRGYHWHYAGGTTLSKPMLDVESGFMLAPMEQGLRITTGAEFAAIDAPATPVQLACAEAATRKLLDLGNPVEPQPWMGARPCTADMLPVIGPAPSHNGLWFNFGHSHQGFTLGPACARLLAEMMAGDAPYLDPAPYAPTRFTG